MKEIYKAKAKKLVILTITNDIEVNSIVYLNDIEFDNVILSEGKNNTRVLEIELNIGDTISVKENDLINYVVTK